MDEEYDPTAFLDEGEHRSEEEQDARIESEWRYDPLKNLNWDRIRRQSANDDAVLEQENRLAALTKDRRDRLRFALSFIDSSSPSETSFDAIREGRSAT